MVKISKDKLNEKGKEDAWNFLLEEAKKINSKLDLKEFFDKFLTPREGLVILRRLAIANLLDTGKTYREIKNTLEVSSNTIRDAKDILANLGYRKKSRPRRNYSDGPKHSRKFKEKYSRWPSYKGA